MNIHAIRLSVMLWSCWSSICCIQTAGQQATPAPPPGETATIKVNVDAVLVPVVVRDAQGRAVGNLQKEDFKVFDQGKLQVISGFTIEKRAASTADLKPVAPASANPHVLAPGSPPPSSTPQRFIAYLFDDLHLSFADLAQAQSAATRMLEGSLGRSDMAAVVSFSGTNSGMTRDHAKLQEAIMNLKLRVLYRQSGRQCPNIDYYLADLIINRHDGIATAAAVQETMSCASLKPEQSSLAQRMVDSTASEALAIGDQDVRVALGFLRELVHRMEALPGDRIVILVSPGFMAITGETMALMSQILNSAAQSRVTVSALDARGLYTTNLDASQKGEGSKLGMMTGQFSQRQGESMAVNGDVMAELADGTGGAFFHNSNDLEGGFKELTKAPEYVYLLEISPQNIKMNGSYHSLKVKVREGGLKLQARRGYFAPKPNTVQK